MEYTKGESVEARIKTLLRLSRWATSAIRSSQLIESYERLDGSMGPLDTYRPYLMVAAHSHRDLGLLYLNSLFETKSNTVNFGAICAHLTAHGVDVSEIPREIEGHSSALKKLFQLRGSAIGHRSAARSYDQTFASVQMTKDELESLLALASRCAVGLAKAARIALGPKPYEPSDNLRSMLEALADAEKRKQADGPWT